MSPGKLLPAVTAGVLCLVAASVSAQSVSCSPGTGQVSAYCPNNTNPDNPAPSTGPTVQPPQPGQRTTVAGTLNGGTQTLEIASSSSKPGTTEFAINLAGSGTLIIKSGDQTVTIVVAQDGTVTIDPGDGGEPITVSGDGHSPGRIEISITPDGVTYSLVDPGEKTVKVGNATATIPGTATITRSEGKTIYNIKGKGDCVADLDPAVANAFNADKAIQCEIESGSSVQSRALATSFGKTRSSDVFKLGNLADRVFSGPGRDLVHGNGGGDIIRGGSNKDSLYGDAGNDRLFGDGSDDHLYGGAGNDRIRGGDGRDFVDGGSGNDVIRNTAQSLDTIKCGSGRDVVYAGPLDKVFSDCEVVHRGR
jgi:Ca2+-binding RTX toxin-like protein